MGIYVGYQEAKHCTSGPTPGCKALMAWFLAAYARVHARNDGIFNCRPIRGTRNTTSLHGEGRAADLGCHAGDPWAHRLADRLRLHSKELGIQCVIYNRRIWSGAHPHEGWRRYGGVDAHTTHLHVELGWPAARRLTVKRLRRILGDLMPTPKPASWPGHRLDRGARGPAVARVQRKVGATDDGVYGPKTAAAVERWQRQHHRKPYDGAVDASTWRAMFG